MNVQTRKYYAEKIQSSMPVIVLLAFFAAAFSMVFISPAAGLITPMAIILTFNLLEAVLTPREEICKAQRSRW